MEAGSELEGFFGDETYSRLDQSHGRLVGRSFVSKLVALLQRFFAHRAPGI